MWWRCRPSEIFNSTFMFIKQVLVCIGALSFWNTALPSGYKVWTVGVHMVLRIISVVFGSAHQAQFGMPCPNPSLIHLCASLWTAAVRKLTFFGASPHRNSHECGKDGGLIREHVSHCPQSKICTVGSWQQWNWLGIDTSDQRFGSLTMNVN